MANPEMLIYDMFSALLWALFGGVFWWIVGGYATGLAFCWCVGKLREHRVR